jgi:hypothetical protein
MPAFSISAYMALILLSASTYMSSVPAIAIFNMPVSSGRLLYKSPITPAFDIASA